MTSPTDIDNLFKSIKEDIVVIHAAGIVSIASKYDKRVYDVNVGGTRNMVNMALKYKVKKFIYVSSVHAIPEGEKGSCIKEIDNFNPDEVLGVYAKTKSEASSIVMNATKNGLNATIVHPSGIIGPNDYNIGHTTRMIYDYLDGHLTAAVNGGYDFVDVRDVTSAILKSIDTPSGKTYLLTNRYISVKELLDTLSDISGHKKIKTYLPLWFIKPLAPLAEFYYKLAGTKPLFTAYSLYTLNSNANFTHAKASKELDYQPRELKDTLRDTYNWLITSKMIDK